MEQAIIIVLSVLSPIVAIASFIIAQSREVRKRGQDDGSLKKDIEFIKDTTSSIQSDLRKIDDKVDNHTERIAIVEQSAKALHKRMDEHLKNNKGG